MTIPSPQSDNGDSHDADPPSTPPRFTPQDRTSSQPDIHLPDELWLTILDSPCTFNPSIFTEIMYNLIKNPNITSSHLFRADIYYDSDEARPQNQHHFREEYRPLAFSLPGYETTRTIVRKLIPRNPQLDDHLLQTCHFLFKSDSDQEETLVIYTPHVRTAEEMPFYHPAVSRLAFTHTQHLLTKTATISISYSLFPSPAPSTPLPSKLTRTALRLLQTLHKHGQGKLSGYEKRVHLDQLIPQKRYQDTYARLKAKYGRFLAEKWVEVTDASKHVFEDIAIAAFLVELWGDLYSFPDLAGKPPFPGFVDIGCGNGVLVYILLSEKYPGWGFDARARKTWSTFPAEVQAKLQKRLLVPSIFPQQQQQQQPYEQPDETTLQWTNGLFPKGTFIISNHADELTAWTPLLAYLTSSSFVAIPCCSHDFTGARFRAPPSKMLSAYASLVSYVESLAVEVGFETQREVLRIPSTRNLCVFGKYIDLDAGGGDGGDGRLERVVGIVEREVKMSVEAVGKAWVERGMGLGAKPGSGH
ncbi:uracil-O(2)--methyltransferase [Neohortaea acidophila]|uniref:tRNA (uracil-O(2)-)-methyltransferase n=1 Tax=Neohortaea acidophila TaxID=245834 RepID=A0A6A6PI20_9PEZI|nr:uracil-O(2)--methyltransferase [Neohortaea acidophila]KAF2479381.1 uracil-O(2)--methyltransferase [Neohortaea acidophila]